MPENELGATLRLDHDKAAAAATAKALDIAKQKTEALNKTNADSAKAFDKAFAASRAAAKATSDAGGRGGAAGGGNVPAAAKFRGAASQIGGGEIVGLIDDLQDLGEGLVALRSSIKDLPAAAKAVVSAVGAGNLGMVGVIAAAAIAITLIQQQVAAQTAKTRGVIDSLTEVASLAATGTTESITAAIQEQESSIRGLEAAKKTAGDVLAGLEAGIQQLNPAQRAILEFNTAIGTGGAELKAAREAADAATKAYNEGTIGLDGLKGALDDASVAANDLAAEEKKLAEERTKAVLDSAAAAGEEVTSRRRAMDATEEQNLARLKSIGDERAAIEAQLAVLQSSGDTSEQVTDQISKLNAQLGALGNESQFIEGTALALSKERDAAKKATEDAKKLAEEAERNQEAANQKRLQAAQQYTDSLIDIATDAADAAEDALQELKDALGQNELNFARDIDKLSQDATRSRLEHEIELQQQEAADLREHQRTLESIRDEAILSEADALKKRNFLEAARIREAANLSIEAENKAFEVGQSEKAIAEEAARSKEERELDNARQERLAQLQQANDDARAAYEQQLRDDEIGRERSERDAAIARDRQLAQADELAKAVLDIKQLQADTEVSIFAHAYQTIAGMANSFTPPQMANAGGAGAVNNSTFNANRTIGSLSIPINGATNPQAIQQQMMQILGQVGLMPSR